MGNLGTNLKKAGSQVYQAGVDLTDTASEVYHGRVGILESSDHYGRQINFNEATQNLSTEDKVALKDPNSSSEAYQSAMNNLNKQYMAMYGVSEKEAEKIMLADIKEAGFRTKDGFGIYLNDTLAHSDRDKSNETAGHEIVGHGIDAVKGFMKNPKVKKAVEKGKKEHKKFAKKMDKKGYETEKAIPGTKGKDRPDAWKVKGDTVEIRELKPNSKSGTKAYERQSKRYKEFAEKAWSGKKINIKKKTYKK